MSKKVYDFQTQLKKGEIAEKKFMEIYHKPLLKFAERRADFVCHEGLIIELKSDFYGLESGNFFFEKTSNRSSGKPGGPWQSLANRCDVFVYYYPTDSVYFEFSDVYALVKRLEKIVKKREPLVIVNKGFSGDGFLVERHLVDDLYVEYSLEEGKKKETKGGKK